MALSEVPIPLIEAARSGDQECTERLLHLISPDVYRIIFSMLRDHDNTDEVAQEALIRIFRYISKLKDPQKFSSWTMRVVVNQVQSWRMKQNRKRLHELPEGLEPKPEDVMIVGVQEVGPREAAISAEVRQEIEDALHSLPNRQQMAMTLFEIEGSSIREVAEAMGCSEGAVKFNIHEARKKMQAKLQHLFPGAKRLKAKRRTASGS